MRIAIDMDGIIAQERSDHLYEESKPFPYAISIINDLHKAGHYIIIFTGRFMRRTRGNINAAYSLGYKLTKQWLDDNAVQYDELILGKPDYDLLLDDKAICVNSLHRRTWQKALKLIHSVKKCPRT